MDGLPESCSGRVSGAGKPLVGPVEQKAHRFKGHAESPPVDDERLPSLFTTTVTEVELVAGPEREMPAPYL